MEILFFLITIFFSLGQLARITLFERQINFYIYEIFLLIVLLTLIFKFKLEPIKYFWKNFKEFFLFFLILILSLIFNFNQFVYFQNLVGLLYFLRLFFYFVYFFYLYYFVRNHQYFKKNIQVSLNIFIILTIISTITQFFLYPDLRNLMYLGWDPHLGRTFGVFFDTSIAAVIYGLIFFISNNFFIKIIYLFFLIFSFSRGVILSFIFTLLYVFLKNKQSVFRLIIFIIFLIIVLILVPKPFGEGSKLTRTYTIISRINDYKEGWNLFLKKPIFGWGYNRLRYVRNIENSHAASNFSSSYLTILVSSGFLGLLSFLFLLNFFWKKFKNKRELLILIGLTSFFDNIFLHPFILFLFFTSLFDN
ncbi:MAG: hypothetical protein KatS3mg092_0798 [Patescibacteria group bacterium]|nr:MAG: hypothetical protein KatS3mg092_0798 [Patescibacteria group bacterium]